MWTNSTQPDVAWHDVGPTQLCPTLARLNSARRKPRLIQPDTSLTRLDPTHAPLDWSNTSSN